jgi:integrase
LKNRRKDRVEQRRLADGSIKTYRYAARKSKPNEAKTVSAVLAAWQMSPEWDSLKSNTKAAYVRYTGPLYDAYKIVAIKDVKRKHILAIRDAIARERGHGAASGFCKACYSFFKWAADRDYVDISPATKLEGTLKRGTLPTWTLEQALAAEAGLPKHYARAVFLARHTAQRRGDICALRWSQYDGAVIRLTQEKTGTPMTIPVTAELKLALDNWKREARGLTILEGENGAPMKRAVLSVQLPKELARLGLPAGLNIHGLRKLAAKTLADVGCSTHEIAAMTGHKTLSMVQLYTQAADQRVLSEAAVLRLADFQTLPKKGKA